MKRKLRKIATDRVMLGCTPKETPPDLSSEAVLTLVMADKGVPIVAGVSGKPQ